MASSSMITLHALEKLPTLPLPIALTIGTFDGVHLGHQHLFQQLKKRGTAVVLTFSNHPSEVLRPDHPTSLLYSTDQKIELFQTYDIDVTLILPFTAELAQTPYDVFIKKIHQMLPFSFLLLGTGSILGAGGKGDEKHIKILGNQLQFEAIYLPKFTLDGEIVSSRRIRELIKIGNLELAHKLLGRFKG